VWSPDGKRIVFRSSRDGNFNLYEKEVGGTAQEVAIDKDQRYKIPTHWSRDGRYILETVTLAGRSEIWVLPVSGNRKALPYLQSKFEGYGFLSPGGEWLVYESLESGRAEVYVQTFPKPGGKWQVSTDAEARPPQWSRDGKELYYTSGAGKLMAVPIKGSGGRFEPGTPQALFDAPPPLPGGASSIEASKDGRFLILAPTEESLGAPITLLVNWTAGLKK
jgi:Tol biopolymer transport system component